MHETVKLESNPNHVALHLARWIVITFAIFTFVAIVVGLALTPDYAARNLSEFTPNAFWTYEQTQAGLTQLGWPAKAMVWVEVGRSLFLTLVMAVVGLLILWRKSRDWFGLYLAFAFLASGVGGSSLTRPLIEQFSGFEWFYDAVGAISWQLFFIIFYFFPNGRPVPGWTRWIALAWGGFIIVYLISPEFADNYLQWLAFPFVFTALGSQIYRYFRRADAVQRQQTKWVVASIVVVLLTIGLITPTGFDPPTGPDFGPALLQATIILLVLNAGILLIPVAITISILFYRLWDIDVIIRKTLIYTVLSGVLALVYFGMVILLQSVFDSASGQQSPIAIVISTLVIAAIFSPLRRRVQDAIDRRFFRQKVDAQQVLARFAQTARDETDIDKLTAELNSVVEQTLQPEHSAVWMKPVRRDSKRLVEDSLLREDDNLVPGGLDKPTILLTLMSKE
jgi:hypothetical protein